MKPEYLVCRDLRHAWRHTHHTVQTLDEVRPRLALLARRGEATAILVRTVSCDCGVARIEEYALTGQAGHYTVLRTLSRRMDYRGAPGYLQEPGQRRSPEDFRMESVQLAVDAIRTPNRSARAPRKTRRAAS